MSAQSRLTVSERSAYHELLNAWMRIVAHMRQHSHQLHQVGAQAALAQHDHLIWVNQADFCVQPRHVGDQLAYTRHACGTPHQQHLQARVRARLTEVPERMQETQPCTKSKAMPPQALLRAPGLGKFAIAAAEMQDMQAERQPTSEMGMRPSSCRLTGSGCLDLAFLACKARTSSKSTPACTSAPTCPGCIVKKVLRVAAPGATAPAHAEAGSLADRMQGGVRTRMTTDSSHHETLV